MGMGVDQAGKERVARGVDGFDIRWGLQVRADRFDLAVLNPHVSLVDHFMAVEHASLADDEAVAVVGAGQEE